MNLESDIIKKTAEEGKPIKNILIIDAHSHYGHWPIFYIPDPFARSMISEMDRVGINKCIVSAHASIGPDNKFGNDQVYEATKKYPQRILAYVTINPNYPEEITKELERGFKLGAVGIKIHPTTHNYPANGENYKPVWQFANYHKTFVLSHTWYGDPNCSPTLFGCLAKKYPYATILLGHSGGTYKGYQESISLAKKIENIYLEICGSEFSSYWLEEMVSQVGPDKIIFGTDFPFHTPFYSFGRVAYAKISFSDKLKIFSANIIKILKGVRS